MPSDTIVASLIVVAVAIGVVISAVAASTHGTLASLYTLVLIGYGVLIVLSFGIAGAVARGRGASSHNSH